MKIISTAHERACRGLQTRGPRTFSGVLTILSVGLILLPLAGAAESGGLHFELMPKAFQSNPELNMTVVTEFTDYGRSFPQASTEHPVYFIPHDGGLKSKGDLLAGEKSPTHEQMERVLLRTLATQGFKLAENPAHSPDIALFYSWGSYNAPDKDMALLFPEAARNQLLERSMLVGGKSFVRVLDSESSDGLFNVFSYAGREKTYEFLLDQAARDIQFVVVSAYSFKDLAHNERRLLWRTSMTVEGTGVSMAQTLQPLVLTAGPYIGREVPATGLRRRVKIGTVELGPIKVIDDGVVASTTR
ncbi:MAG: hypothetical protein ABIZ04_23135 [Opitutus sp.]